MKATIRDYGSPPRSFTPPLESGDVLDADEYWRRYCAVPEKLKAERINRRVYRMNSFRTIYHANSHALLCGWLSYFAMQDPKLIVSNNPTVRLDADNDPQPDLCLLREGGQTRFDVEGYIIGSPELIVEIAGSSTSYDFGEKRDVFEAAAVKEYLVFEAIEGQIAWWRRREGRFVEIAPVQVDGAGAIYKSEYFSGLWLDAEALRSADSRKLVETLQRGIGSS